VGFTESQGLLNNRISDPWPCPGPYPELPLAFLTCHDCLLGRTLASSGTRDQFEEARAEHADVQDALMQSSNMIVELRGQ